jgi:hypothetical protein
MYIYIHIIYIYIHIYLHTCTYTCTDQFLFKLVQWLYIYTYWLAGVQFLKGHFKIHYVFIQIHVYIYIFTVIHIYIHKTYPQLGYIISSNHSDQINLSQDGRRLQDHCRGLRKPPSHKVTRPVISSVKVSDFTAQDFRTAHLTHWFSRLTKHVHCQMLSGVRRLQLWYCRQ